MNVIVNGTTLNVTNAYSERDVATGIITYYIILPQSEMDYYDLKELFKSNTEEIVKTDDDGNVELFANAEYVKTDDDDTNGLYTVILKTNENAHQIARNRQLEADKANLESIVASKNEELTAKDAEIAELLTIAEEYADMVFASLESEEIELPEIEDLVIEESEGM